MKQNFSRLVSPFRSHLMACATFALFSIAVANGQVVVANGSFDGGTLGVGGMDVTNWTLIGSPDLQSAAVHDRTEEINPSPDGGNWVWMANEGVSTTNITGLEASTDYLLSFYVAVDAEVNNWGADHTSGGITVAMSSTGFSFSGGATVSDTDASDDQFEWQLVEFEFTTSATPDPTTLSFTGAATNSFAIGMVLDGVKIAVLPEPSTGLLAILGAVTLLMRRRRRFSC